MSHVLQTLIGELHACMQVSSQDCSCLGRDLGGGQIEPGVARGVRRTFALLACQPSRIPWRRHHLQRNRECVCHATWSNFSFQCHISLLLRQSPSCGGANTGRSDGQCQGDLAVSGVCDVFLRCTHVSCLPPAAAQQQQTALKTVKTADGQLDALLSQQAAPEQQPLGSTPLWRRARKGGRGELGQQLACFACAAKPRRAAASSWSSVSSPSAGCGSRASGTQCSAALSAAESKNPSRTSRLALDADSIVASCPAGRASQASDPQRSAAPFATGKQWRGKTAGYLQMCDTDTGPSGFSPMMGAIPPEVVVDPFGTAVWGSHRLMNLRQEQSLCHNVIVPAHTCFGQTIAVRRPGAAVSGVLHLRVATVAAGAVRHVRLAARGGIRRLLRAIQRPQPLRRQRRRHVGRQLPQQVVSQLHCG